MHRSGTSLLGGILHRLGVSLPGETINGDKHNPDGYYEWADVVDIQERLLIDLDRWWPSHQGTHDLPSNWMDHPRSEQAFLQLQSLVKNQMPINDPVWVIKDPRCSRLIPLWVRLCQSIDIPLRIILAVRDPLEVCSSLISRDASTTGMDINRAQLLWWRHNSEVINYSRKHHLSLLTINYSDWFNNSELQLRRLLAFIPELSPCPSQIDESLSFINPSYRRSVLNQTPYNLNRSVSRLYEQLTSNKLPVRLSLALPKFPFTSVLANKPVKNLTSKPHLWQSLLDYYSHYPAPRVKSPINLSADPFIFVTGYSWLDLLPHLYLNCLPISNLTSLELDQDRCDSHALRFFPPLANCSDSFSSVVINLEFPPEDRLDHWLTHLQAQEIIFDPNPSRVLLLRSLGLNAWWLDSRDFTSGWLDQSIASSPNSWGLHLGLSPVDSSELLLLSDAGPLITYQLALEASTPSNSNPNIHYVPGWSELIVSSISTSLARAGWLYISVSEATRTVLSSSSAHLLPTLTEFFDLANKPFILPDCSSLTDLRQLHSGSASTVQASDRLPPESHILYSWASNNASIVSVVISLFNYSEYIEEALDSVSSQTCNNIELIVVDDCSTDNGANIVLRWIQSILDTKAHPFSRIVLVRHLENAGLAVARNSGFSYSTSDWCFVLDADNILYPNALKYCLNVASTYDLSLAVVHPLLATQSEATSIQSSSRVVSIHSWQMDRFISGNFVDAMALVRRSAWKSVNGYTHIEGGWEDFDFWCKLVDFGFYGIQCPYILANYRNHSSSMSKTQTNLNHRALSHLLQARHPWLNLPLV